MAPRPPVRFHPNLAPALVAIGALACRTDELQVSPHTVVLEENLRLDAHKEDFPTIGRLIIGSKGEIIVALPQDRQVRLYDSTGTRIATVGRHGEAPGEFGFIGALGTKGDTIWVQDAESRRVTYYDPQGKLLRAEHPLPGGQSGMRVSTPDGGYRFVIVSGIRPDGSLLASGRRNREPNERATPQGQSVLNIAPDGGVRRVAISPSYEDPRWMMEVAGLGRPIPFAGGPQVAFAFDGSGFAFLETNISSSAEVSYDVSLFRANGDTVFTRRYEFVGVPIPQSAKDSAANAEIQDDAPTEGPSDLDQRFRRIALEKMPPVYSPVAAFLIGIDRTLWLTLRDSSGLRRTIVLDDKGDQLGVVTLSTRQRIRQATAKTIWVVEADDTDLQSIVRYTVRGLEGKR